MSCIYKGNVIDTNLSRNARGGTEMMRERLLKYVDASLLSKVAIHFSRPREVYRDVKNIFYCHDLVGDPENKVLQNDGWKKFDHFVFVSYWQRDQYILAFRIPYSKCSVIQNAVELEHRAIEKPKGTVNFIYHTTPHRGLELLYPIFDHLSKIHEDIHLDVYSSFKIYGWEQRDKPYEKLFDSLKRHPKITYHGSVSNEEVLTALKKSHIFLYPSIWQETSCIAMIEAIKSDVLVIHPTYGALLETSSGATVPYEFTENVSDHASIAASIALNVLNQYKSDSNFFNRLIYSDARSLPLNGINNFTTRWNELLRKMNT